MSALNAKEMRNAIVQAISKRPQTKFAKIFNELDQRPTQTQIILLLQELNEQKDFYVDFNISLKYFLDLYEEESASSKTFMFNEAGLLIHNATKVYDRRLDCVLQRVEDQLASLSNNAQETKEGDSTPEEKSKQMPLEKPTRKRKRLVESIQDPFDFQWTRRKFKKLPENKRFGPGTKIDRSQLLAKKLHTENYLHPALWKYSEIVDLENEEEVDSKRNYRLFTSYIEHRYNTLVPDINFRLYYKMKDYLDAEDERDSDEININNWPPLSQAFVKQYLKMEDRALSYVQTTSGKRRRIIEEQQQENSYLLAPTSTELEASFEDSIVNTNEITDVSENKDATSNEDSSVKLNESALGTSVEDSAAITNGDLDTSNDKDATLNEENSVKLADSALGTSLEDSTAIQNDNINTSNNNDATLNGVPSEKLEESALGTSTILNSTKLDDVDKSDLSIDNLEAEKLKNQANLDNEQPKVVNEDENVNTKPANNEVTEEIRETVQLTVHIETENGVLNDKIDYCAQPSPQNDEGVCFSDIDEAPLTPITIHVDKSVVTGLENTKSSTLEEDKNDQNNLEQYHLTSNQTPIEFWPIKLNIFEFPREIIKKMRRPKLLTDLGEEMETFLKARCYKRTRNENEFTTRRQIKFFDRSASSAGNVYDTPPPSPCDSVFLGFDESGTSITRPASENEPKLQALKIGGVQRLSRDSGVGNDLLTATPEKNSAFFPTINELNEETDEKNDAAQNLFNVEILDNVLLKAANENILPMNNEAATNAKDKEVATQADEKPQDEKPAETLCDEMNEAATPKPSNESINNEHSTKEASVDDEVVDNFMNITNFNDSESIDGHEHLELCDDTVAKIQNWHRKLQPILAKSRERHHFDIFEIGTNILDEFNNTSQPDGSITFQNVMQHQDASYVSRYFLSALLLANQGNIELKINNKCDDKPSEWCDVSIKLLSTARHVVAVEDNIGMLPTTTSMLTINATAKTKLNKKEELSELLPPPLLPATTPKSFKKRKIVDIAAATAATAITTETFNVNIGGIERIKPIGKKPRLSTSDDSGIASLESDIFDLSAT